MSFVVSELALYTRSFEEGHITALVASYLPCESCFAKGRAESPASLQRICWGCKKIFCSAYRCYQEHFAERACDERFCYCELGNMWYSHQMCLWGAYHTNAVILSDPRRPVWVTPEGKVVEKPAYPECKYWREISPGNRVSISDEDYERIIKFTDRIEYKKMGLPKTYRSRTHFDSESIVSVLDEFQVPQGEDSDIITRDHLGVYVAKKRKIGNSQLTEKLFGS